MRRPRLLAALGAFGIVAICVAGVGIAVAASAPHPERIPIEEAVIPDDFAYWWIQHCGTQVGNSLNVVAMEYSVDAEGHLEVLLGSYTGNEMVPDEELSAAVNECVGTRRVEEFATRWRQATPADRLALYGWAVNRQQPCLAAWGIDTRVPPLSDFLAEDTVPWYLLEQYIWENPEDRLEDFDTILAARLACPAVPDSLAAQGVG